MSWQGFAWRSAFSRISQKSEDEKKFQIFGIYREMRDNLSVDSKDGLLDFIEKDIVGADASFDGPFGRRRIVYCDYVASAKAMHSIEQFVMKCVLPTYANTHTLSNVTGSQTSSFRNESKDIIRNSVRANEDDVLIFTGSGVTGAIHKFISVLELKQPPVIFCGPFEHHSNLLPWREMNGHVVHIGEDSDGKIDMRHLEIALKTWHKSGRPMIGTFSAASNITGITTNTRRVASLLHKYGAVSLWDYATGGPYLDINMHPEPYDGYDSSKDAIFLSMHKFLGSPDAPGLLIASKHLFQNKVPSGVGGGTVLFVSENDHKYLKDIETREEGGTPAIIGSIRAGLAFKLKMAVGCDEIMARETAIYNKAMKIWKEIPELEILGALKNHRKTKTNEDKLAVFSFLIRHPQSGLYLHHNFVTTLLNDLFGIQVCSITRMPLHSLTVYVYFQSRGGCACAGVYAQHLLGIDRDAEKRFGSVLLETPERAKTRKAGESERTDYEITRPGFTRLNFPYFISDEETDFIISAVGMVAKNGWTLLPQYEYIPTSGQWNHLDYYQGLEGISLSDVSFNYDGLRLRSDNQTKQLPCSRIECLKKAERIFFNATTIIGKELPNQAKQFDTSTARELRWFLLPSEAQALLRGKKMETRKRLIFQVRSEIKVLTEEQILNSLLPPSGASPVAKKNDRSTALIAGNDNALLKKNKKKKFVFKSLFCRTENAVDIISEKGVA